MLLPGVVRLPCVVRRGVGVVGLPAESLRELLDLALDGVDLKNRREGGKCRATSRRKGRQNQTHEAESAEPRQDARGRGIIGCTGRGSMSARASIPCPFRSLDPSTAHELC